MKLCYVAIKKLSHLIYLPFLLLWENTMWALRDAISSLITRGTLPLCLAFCSPLYFPQSKFQHYHTLLE